MEVMNLIEQPIKVTEWQQTYTYDSGIHSGVNTCVPSVSSKGIMDEDDACGRQYTLKKTTTYTQGVPQNQGLDSRVVFFFFFYGTETLAGSWWEVDRGGPWFERSSYSWGLRKSKGEHVVTQRQTQMSFPWSPNVGIGSAQRCQWLEE